MTLWQILLTRRLRSLAAAVAVAVLVAGLFAGNGRADDGSDSSSPGDGMTWPPTEIAWPPESGESSADEDAAAGEPSAPLPTPIVIPGAPPIMPTPRPRRNFAGRPTDPSRAQHFSRHHLAR